MSLKGALAVGGFVTSAVLVELTIVTQTDAQTNHATSVAIGRIRGMTSSAARRI